jgi:hypothetical protein
MANQNSITDLFAALKDSIAARLDAIALAQRDSSQSVDPADSRNSRDSTPHRQQNLAFLEHLANFLITGDLRTHRDFLQSLLAMRTAQSQSASSVMAQLTEIGDTAARVVQNNGDDQTHRDLVFGIASATASTVRLCNELVAKDLEYKIAQRDELMRANLR